MKGTTTGKDIYVNVNLSLDKFDIDGKKFIQLQLMMLLR